MKTQSYLYMAIVLTIYIAAHSAIIAGLFRARRRLNKHGGSVPSGWLFFSTATPVVGPILSCIAFAKLARAYQWATRENRAFRSDCGYVVGIGYGLASLVSIWFSKSEAGLLAFLCLIVYFIQLRNSARTFEISVADGLSK